MIRTRKDLTLYLKEDAIANSMIGISFWEYCIKLYAGSESAHIYKYLKCLRHCEYHCNNSGQYHRLMYYFYKIKLHRMGFKYNVRIPENICGFGLSLIHFAGGGGCIVNAKRVGNHCKLQTGVVIGNTHHSEEEKPVIGDNVSFGPGAMVFGSVNVGDNAFILANSVVTKDVPSDTIVGGIPAQIIKRKD